MRRALALCLQRISFFAIHTKLETASTNMSSNGYIYHNRHPNSPSPVFTCQSCTIQEQFAGIDRKGCGQECIMTSLGNDDDDIGHR